MSSRTIGHRRRYRMRARADAADATRQRILDAATQLFLSSAYDDMSLQLIAERAGVALKTILRRFGSKDGLLLECGRRYAGAEGHHRSVEVGDIAQAAHVLAERYEQTMDMMLRYIAVEARVPVVAELLAVARTGHRKWLARVFAPYLPERPGRVHRQRIAQLYTATEIYAWHGWRRRLGLGRQAAEDALRDMLEALIAGWIVRGREAKERATWVSDFCS